MSPKGRNGKVLYKTKYASHIYKFIYKFIYEFIDMANIAKYKSAIHSRSRSMMSKTRTSQKRLHFEKRKINRALRCHLKTADDESGCQISGTYWT